MLLAKRAAGGSKWHRRVSYDLSARGNARLNFE